MILLAIPFLLFAAFAAVFCLVQIFRERGAPEYWQTFVRLSGFSRLVVSIGLLVAVWAGADKGGGGFEPLGARVQAIFLTIMGDGSLRGPTDTIASASQAAQIAGVNASASSIVATVSNTLQWVRDDIPVLESIVTNTHIAWLTSDGVSSTNNPNISARCDLISYTTNASGSINAYVHVNVTPSTAPIVMFQVESEFDTVPCMAVSNSFPDMVPIQTPDGVSSCYVYTVTAPTTKSWYEVDPDTGEITHYSSNIPFSPTLIPVRNMSFGAPAVPPIRSALPLQVLGGLMVNNKMGRTTTTITNGTQRLTFEGGVLVGVQ